MAKKFPNTHFAITDYSSSVPPLGSAKFKPLSPPLQILTPTFRMDLPLSPEALAVRYHDRSIADLFSSTPQQQSRVQ